MLILPSVYYMEPVKYFLKKKQLVTFSIFVDLAIAQREFHCTISRERKNSNKQLVFLIDDGRRWMNNPATSPRRTDPVRRQRFDNNGKKVKNVKARKWTTQGEKELHISSTLISPFRKAVGNFTKSFRAFGIVYSTRQ